MLGKVVKDKRIFECGVRFRAEVEFFDGTVIDLGGDFKTLNEAQKELNHYAVDVPLYKEVPQSVFIRNPQ